MKARNREINIFNMSLLDILCGALGAICFMMVSLLPYYRPPGEDMRITQEQQKLLESVQDMKDLTERLKHITSAEDLSQLVKELQEKIAQLENEIKRLQGTVNKLLADNDELKKKIQALEQEKQQLQKLYQDAEAERQRLAGENTRLQNTLDARQPWLVQLESEDPSQSLECTLVEMRIARPSGEKQPPFDPTVRVQPAFWKGDIATPGPTGIYVSQDRIKGSEMKLYASLFTEPKKQKSTEVSGFVTGNGFTVILVPPATLAPERPWMLMGTVSIGDDRIPKFAEATAEERDAEWRKLTGKEPPKPPPPAPLPPPKAPSRPDSPQLSQAEMDRARNFVRAILAAKTDEEKKQIQEKALREATSDQERERLKRMMSTFTGTPQTPAPNPQKK